MDKFNRMKPVVQEELSGCGIASVAMLAGVTYHHVRQVAHGLGISVDDSRLWAETAYVRRLLRYYGIRASRNETPFVSWEKLPPVALLAVKWHQVNGRAFWHWVVFWRGPEGPVVLDPKRALRTHVRTDFGRINPAWFIRITVPRHEGR